MNISRLKYFKALCNSKNYTKAAEQSFISQPALYIAIRNLEAELGVQLFSKDCTSVTLTAAGEKLYPLINRVLTDVDCIYKEAGYAADDSCYNITLGVPYYIDTELLLDIKTQFSKFDRNAEVVIVQYSPNTVESEIASGRFDCCILPKPITIEHISYIDYIRQELCVYADASHPFFNQFLITPPMISSEIVITSNSDGGLAQCIIDYAKENGVDVPEFNGSIYDKWTAIHMIDSKSVAIFPKSDSDYGFCRQISLDPPLYQDFVLAWSNEIPLTSMQTKLFDFILNEKTNTKGR